MTKLNSKRIKRQLGDIIGSTNGDSGENDNMSIESIKKAGDEATLVLRNMVGESPVTKNVFYGEYKDVSLIKETVQSVHYKSFRKYYKQFADIFDQATSTMKKSFATVDQGARKSLLTL